MIQKVFKNHQNHQNHEKIDDFFPGDWVYNQYQEWEQDAGNPDFEAGPLGARYDANFDIFKFVLLIIIRLYS